MKRYGYWIVGIFILFLIVGIFLPNEEDNENITGSIIDSPVKQQEVDYLNEKEVDYLNVTYIVDGDTIEIETGKRVRLICMDAPERGEEGYQNAREYLEDLILNKKVKLEKDISEIDRYGRLLRYIYLKDGTFVNELIVKEGYAKVYWYEPDTSLCPIIEEAEDYAKRYDLGIWEEEEKILLEIEEEKEEPLFNQEHICDSNFYNCGDFSTHAEAQEIFESCGGVNNDIHQLDKDKDSIACESLP